MYREIINGWKGDIKKEKGKKKINKKGERYEWIFFMGVVGCFLWIWYNGVYIVKISNEEGSGLKEEINEVVVFFEGKIIVFIKEEVCIGFKF